MGCHPCASESSATKSGVVGLFGGHVKCHSGRLHPHGVFAGAGPANTPTVSVSGFVFGGTDSGRWDPRGPAVLSKGIAVAPRAEHEAGLGALGAAIVSRTVAGHPRTGSSPER